MEKITLIIQQLPIFMSRHFYNGGEDRDFIYTSKGGDRFELANRIFNVGNGENYFELDLGIGQGFDFEYKGGSGQDTVKSGGYWFGANAYHKCIFMATGRFWFR